MILLSGFDYFDTWEIIFPPPPGKSAGIGHLEIPLPKGYRAKDWTIQLRWPMEMHEVVCYTDTVTDMGCYGDLSAGLDGQTCTLQHFHVTPHFWDANVIKLGIELQATWYRNETFQPSLDGPIPCVDWCDDGAKIKIKSKAYTEFSDNVQVVGSHLLLVQE